MLQHDLDIGAQGFKYSEKYNVCFTFAFLHMFTIWISYVCPWDMEPFVMPLGRSFLEDPWDYAPGQFTDLLHFRSSLSNVCDGCYQWPKMLQHDFDIGAQGFKYGENYTVFKTLSFFNMLRIWFPYVSPRNHLGPFGMPLGGPIWRALGIYAPGEFTNLIYFCSSLWIQRV